MSANHNLPRPKGTGETGDNGYLNWSELTQKTSGDSGDVVLQGG